MAETKKIAQVKKTVAKSTAKVKTSATLSVDVLDHAGKVVGTVELSKEVFGQKPNEALIAQAIRIYLANQRLGTATAQTRGEVRGGGKKPWRQKGTGRARIGSTRAPHWRGGGVTFGPVPKDFTLSMPKKMKQKALLSAIISKLNDKELLVINNLDLKEAKTKEAATVIKNLKITGKTIFIDAEIKDKEKRAFKNIAAAKVEQVNNLNTYQVLYNKNLFFTKDALKKLEKSFTTAEKA